MTAAAACPVYAVADRAVSCDRPIAALAALRTEQSPDFTVRRRSVALPPQALGLLEERSHGSAQVGARSCRVHSLATSDRDLLRISGAGLFAIPRGQARIDVDPEPGAGEDAVAEALLGPALAVALARGGTFVLHASAVVLHDRGVIGFLGESGAGKSTLARLVAAGEGISLAADDLLAITVRGEAAVALPHFPQLKLDAAAMAAIAGLAPRYPLLGLYVLAPAPPAAAVDATAALPAGSAAAHLLRHTIAGSLFAEDLLAAHLGFAAEVAGRVPLHLLTVPRRLDVGAEVLKCLLEHGERQPRTGIDSPGDRSEMSPRGERGRTVLRAETLLRPSPGVLFTELEDEAVLLDLKRGTYFGLNAVASRIWQMIVANICLGAIRDRLLEEYDAQADRIWQDIEELVGELMGRGLVAVDSAPDGEGHSASGA